VSFETSFDSKQPKLVSALSETKRLFWLFRFYTETESFDVSIEPKQREEQPKQFDREHILLFFTENVGFFRFFRLFRNSLFRLFHFFTKTESFDVSIKPKQTEGPSKQFKREYIFGLLRNRSVCFGCFDIGSKHRNKQNFFFGFKKQTETNAKQILFRFVSVRTKIYFCLFRGHPSAAYQSKVQRSSAKCRDANMGRVAQGAEKLAQNGTVTSVLLSMLLRAQWVKA
jgi:hypothetical protein